MNDALRIFTQAMGNPTVHLKSIRADESLGEVLGENVTASLFIPQVDRSIVDGYAIRYADLRNASESNPMVLQVVGESRIGEVCVTPVRSGQAVTVATGSGIPPGADTVIMIERTKVLSEREVAVLDSATLGQHISRKGEDVKPGDIVLVKGRRVRALDVGLAKGVGARWISVVRKPRVGITSTGNELTDIPKPKQKEKIVDISRPILSRMVQEQGGVAVDLGIARDKESEIETVLRKGVRSCDAVLVTAGSSVGEKDLVPRCINQLGKPGMVVHGVAMRPAMPTGLAVVRGKPILSLPGFPISTIFAFRVFGRPMIARLLGTETMPDPVVRAVLKERVSSSPGLRTFVRVMVKKSPDGFVAEPLKIQRASVTMSLVAANGIVTLPEDVTSVEAGQEVDVEVIGEITA